MAMAPSSLQRTLTVLAVLLLLASTSTLVMVRPAEAAPPQAPSLSTVYHMELIHVDAQGNFTRDELIWRAQRRSRARAAALPDASSSPRSPPATAADGKTYLETASYSGEDAGEYLVNLSVGNPEKTFLAVADTGSDKTWTRNMKLCSNTLSSFECPWESAHGKCVFKKMYGRHKLTVTGFVAIEILTLSSCRFGGNKCQGPEQVSMPLGCANMCANCDELLPKRADGVVGLNQGPDSFLSHLRENLGITKFSYCLCNRLNPEMSSQLWFGGDGLRLPEADAASAQLVSIAANKKSVDAYKYYVELEGVSIRGKGFTKIPSECFNQRSKDRKGRPGKGKGAMFVDSGCPFSKLESAAFNQAKNLLLEELGNPEPVDDKDWAHCFKLSNSQRDAEKNTVLILHLTSGSRAVGAEMPLPSSRYMTTTKDGKSCLTFTDHGQNISILGNFQQQNIHMLFDLPSNKLRFVPVEDCSKREMN